jgi:Uma2 family endonuclease
VSDTSLDFDLKTKARSYGKAGISEYWIVDLAGRRLLVLRNPNASGYGSVVAYSDTESCAPLASPGDSVLVGDLLPPR